MLSSDDWLAIWLTIKLALTSTAILIVLGTPLALWLAKTNFRFKGLIKALVALPLVLPPTVLGFYLLILLGPQGPLGKLTQALGLGLWPFTFRGLVLASVIYSAPFVIQPLANAFEAIGRRPLEVASTLGVSPFKAFFTVLVPLTKSSFITAAVLGMAHTIGEFGVVLMIGGNIPGVTKVISTQIYGHVEAMEYTKAHFLAGGLLITSFTALAALQMLNPAKEAK